MIQIKMARCLLILTEQEILSLLARGPALWALALRRGKFLKRQQRTEQSKKEADDP